MPHHTTDDGCRIAYALSGPEHAPSLVLSNSLGTDRGLWAAQIDALSRHYRVLSYDTRGHGASDAPAGDYTLARLGRDVVSLMDARGHGACARLRRVDRRDHGAVARRARRRPRAAAGAGQHRGPDRLGGIVERTDRPGAQRRTGRAGRRHDGAVVHAGVPSRRAGHGRPDAGDAARRAGGGLPGVLCGASRCRPAGRGVTRRRAVPGRDRAPTTWRPRRRRASGWPGRSTAPGWCELEAAHLSNVECAPAFTAAVLDFLDRVGD